MPGWREARLALGMRLHGAPDAEILIPTGAISPSGGHAAEAALNSQPEAVRVSRSARDD